MKNLSILSPLLLVFVSCKKEEPAPYEPQQSNSTVDTHYAYFKGTVTDSATGLPVTGYNIQVNGPGDSRDTLIDGTYDLTVLWSLQLPKTNYG